MILLPPLETCIGFNPVCKQVSDKTLIDLSSRLIKPCQEGHTWSLILQPSLRTVNLAHANSLTSFISPEASECQISKWNLYFFC